MKNVIAVLVGSSFLITLASSFLSSRNFDTWFKMPFFSVFILSLLFLIILNIQRKLPAQWSFRFMTASCVALAVSLVFVVLDYLIYPNFIFSISHINIPASINPGMLLSVYAIVCLNYGFIRKKSAYLLTLFPLWLLEVVSVFWLYYPDLYRFFKIEDSAVEYLTFLCFAAVFIYSVKSLKYHRGIYFLAFSAIALVSFFIAAEEISWGQRIIGFRTPENVRVHNEQQEFNFHNNRFFMSRINMFYAFLTSYAVFMPLLALRYKKIPKKGIIGLIFYFAPPRYLVNFFLPMLLFSLTRLLEFLPVFPNYPEETLEFLLGSGLALTVYAKYKNSALKD